MQHGCLKGKCNILEKYAFCLIYRKVVTYTFTKMHKANVKCQLPLNKHVVLMRAAALCRNQQQVSGGIARLLGCRQVSWVIGRQRPHRLSPANAACGFNYTFSFHCAVNAGQKEHFWLLECVFDEFWGRVTWTLHLQCFHWAASISTIQYQQPQIIKGSVPPHMTTGSSLNLKSRVWDECHSTGYTSAAHRQHSTV